jgi:hypothetical protein
VIIGIVSLFAAAGIAGADPAPAAVAANDYTLVGPTDEALERYRPDYAETMHAVVNCVATPQQTLGDCKVVSTIPAEPAARAARISDRALHVVATMKLKRPDGWKAGPTAEPISVTISWLAHGRP